jgi:hypothetical protein
MQAARGNQSFETKHGAQHQAIDAEDFFASSPSANLVSMSKKDTVMFLQV